MDSQEWEDEQFCKEYRDTWEISLDEVHYGWLSDGENNLELLGKVDFPTANILDVGCGLGQNLVALSKKGAKCYGLDISKSMLEKALEIIKHNEVNDLIQLQLGDMRNFMTFNDVEFDVILSVYSMEYLSGVQELRTVIHNLFKRLKSGGLFLMCFSHPSQAHRHPNFVNKSTPHGQGKYRILNYSFKDATEALIKAGFSIERIIEQQTKNPSQIDYEQAKAFPYHFREGRSPFVSSYDKISNDSPHTIIYAARKVYDPTIGIPKRKNTKLGYRELWGYKRKILKYTSIAYLGHSLNCFHLAKRDNILGLVDVLNFDVNEKDISEADAYVSLDVAGYEDVFTVSANSISGIIHRKLDLAGVKPIYKIFDVDSGEEGIKEKRIFIESILGLEEVISQYFQSRKLGLLTFVNGQEPSMGELPLDVVRAKKGDNIQFVYLAYSDNIKQGNLF